MAIEFRSSGSRKKNARRTSSAQRRFQHVLDVSVRSTLAGRQRQRWIVGWASKIFIVAALGTALYFGVRKAVSWVILKNPEYNVADIDVQTDGILEAEQILQTADLQKGGNIFLVNLNRAKTRIESIPEVEHAQVGRQLPSRITVQITERKPVAWLSTAHGIDSRDEVVASKGSFLIDANGVLLLPRKLSPQARYLPIIRHYIGTTVAEGAQTEGDEIKAALDLIRAHQDSLVASRFQLQEIDLAKRYGLLATDRNGTQVLFDLTEMDRQLKRLDSYLQYTDQHGQRIQTINLLVQKNVPVTYMVDAVVTDKPADPPPTASPNPTASTSSAKPVASPAKDKSSDKEKKTNGKSGSSDKKRDEAKPTTGSSRRDRTPQPFLRPPTRVTPTGVE